MDPEKSYCEGDVYGPPTKDAPTPRIWKHTDPYRYAPDAGGNPWEECMRRIDQYNDDSCRGWKEDIDTLLVFAGLFSAAVTAFTIESYQWLKPDPANDTVLLLQQISQQIGNSTGTTAFPRTPSSDQNFSVPASSIRINVFWFLSLMTSLSSVLLGITCRQWIQEHRRETYTTSRKEALALSQLRDESLRRWGVPGLFASLPMMLQLALVLFFAGLLDLLWSLNTVVAAVVSGPIGITVLFLLGTTVLPTYWLLFFSKQRNGRNSCPCAYKSPQAWFFYRAITYISSKWFGAKIPWHQDWSRSDLYTLQNVPGSMEPRVIRGLRWAAHAFSNTLNMAIHIFRCFQDLHLDEAALALEYQSATLDALSLWYFTNLQCGWDDSTERFIAELYLRGVEKPPAESNKFNMLSPFYFIEKARFFDLKLKQDDGSYPLAMEASHQVVGFIRNYFEDNKASPEDLRPLFNICRQLWTDPNEQIQEQSIPLLKYCATWLSSAPVSGGTIPIRVEHCASTILSIVQDAKYSSAVHSILSAHIEEFLHFVKSIDFCAFTYNVDVDGILSPRNFDMTWQEGKTTLGRLITQHPSSSPC